MEIRDEFDFTDIDNIDEEIWQTKFAQITGGAIVKCLVLTTILK